MQFRRGSGSHRDLLCVHSPGFAKKTFISYSKSFKSSFRQGVVVEIDLKNQTVLLQDGEVSRAHGCLWGPGQVHLAGPAGGERPLAPSPAWCGEQLPHKQRPGDSSHECWGRHFLSLS